MPTHELLVSDKKGNLPRDGLRPACTDPHTLMKYVKAASDSCCKEQVSRLSSELKARFMHT